MLEPDLTREQIQYIHDFSRLLKEWRMPILEARVYCYLQLLKNPASLEEIDGILNSGQNKISAAAKELVKKGCAIRTAERGSRRVRYVASDDLGAPLRGQIEILNKMANVNAVQSVGVISQTIENRLIDNSLLYNELSKLIAAALDGSKTTKR